MTESIPFKLPGHLPPDGRPPAPGYAAEAPPGLGRWVTALSELRSATAGKEGEEFLRALARHLAAALQVKWVLISEPADPRPTRARSLVFWSRDGFAPNFEYDLAGTPSARVLGAQLCFYPHSLRQRFPDDRQLAEMGCASYAGAPLRAAGGELLGLLAILHDEPLPEVVELMAVFQLIAERAGAELERLRMRSALRESEMRFRSIIEGVTDLVLVVEPEGRIRYASPSSRRFGGFAPEELQDRSAFDFIHPDDRAAAREALEAAAAAGGPGPSVQCRALHKSGAWFHVEARGTALLQDPFVRGIVINARDITDRWLAQRRLAFQRNLLQRLNESSPDALLMVAADREILYLNHRFAELWDIPGHTLLRRDADAWPHALAKVEDAETLAAWTEELPSDPARKLQAEVRLRDGRCLEVHSTPVASPADQRSGRLWSFRDVTERKNLDARLLHAQRLECMGTVASGIVHEFRNILFPILAGVDLVSRDLAADHPLQSRLDDMRQAAERAQGLTQHLLTLGRPRQAVFEVAEPAEVLASGVKLLRASLPSSVQLALRCAPKLPRIAVDEVQLHQALLNLGINSWQAMPDEEGAIDIGVTACDVAAGAAVPAPGLAPGRYLQIAFADNGRGMDPSQLARVFEPFFTTKPAGQGTGLGLTTVRTIVVAHRGAIAVASEPGQGTVFRIFLPAADGSRPASKSPMAGVGSRGL